MSYNVNNRKIFDSHSHIGRFGKWRMKGNKVEPFKHREVTNAEKLYA